MDQTYENDSPTIPAQNFAPFNFRKIIQRQIKNTVDNQLDAYSQMSNGKADGRYSNSRPSTTLDLVNPYGLRYFVAGKTVVGQLYVAAP